MQVIMKRVPPAGEVLLPRGRTGSSFGRDRLLRVFHHGEPDIESLAVVHSLFPRHLGERRDEVIPADQLARDLQVPCGGLGAVIERVSGKKSKIRERD